MSASARNNASLRRASKRRRKRPPLWPAIVVAAALPGCASPGVLAWNSSGRAGQSQAQPVASSSGANDVVQVSASVEPPGAGPGPAEAVPHGPTYNPAPVVPPSETVFPIDLTTALRLAEVENPQIAEARQRIREALALRQSAYALLLPTLNAGTMYHGHTGNLQRSSGRILSLSEQSLYVGGGTRTLAAETVGIPAVNITSPLTDAIFEPLAARQNLAGVRFNAAATANSVLLDVANLYFELLYAEAALESRRAAVSQGMEVARLTRAYAEAEQGRPADAERAATELSLLEREYQQAEEEVAVASARLARRLHLEQVVRVRPSGPGIEPITLVDPNTPLPSLIQQAVQRRPEVAARGALVEAAQTRVRQEVARPLLPNLWLGFSGGALGGGSNLVPPFLGNFGGRTDFDVRVFWTVSNFGFGNLNLQRRRRAEVGQAMGEQSRMIAQVRSEVAAAYADVMAARQRMTITELQFRSAESGYGLDVERIRNEVGRPIEVVNSLRLLNRARIDRVRAITDFDQAEFRLFVALGSPPPLDRPPTDPLPPAPIAPPFLPPLDADGNALPPPFLPPSS